MSFHRTKATFIGLFEAKRANEWVVTEKLGDAHKNKNNKSAKKFNFNIGDRYASSTMLSMFTVINSYGICLYS